MKKSEKPRVMPRASGTRPYLRTFSYTRRDNTMWKWMKESSKDPNWVVALYAFAIGLSVIGDAAIFLLNL